MSTVVRVRKESSSDGTHQHIAGVCLVDGTYRTRAQVVQGLDRGEAWFTSGGGTTARIKKITYCPRSGCPLSPYITTAPDHTTSNNLDNLPPC
jgi:hypothetical protein